MSARSEDTSIFIDGEYLRRRFCEAMHDIFRCNVTDEDIDYSEIKREASAKRAFFYDCVDDEKHQGESEEAFQERVATQESFFRQIGALKGFHVRHGSLKGTGRKRRQKEVDVLLAADMLTHGYDGNMETAILLAGDLDFRPVVESLVRRGVFVEVWYVPTSASAELPGAADYGRSLSFNTLYHWSTARFIRTNPLPSYSDAHAPVTGILIKESVKDGRKVQLIKYQDGTGSVLKMETPDRVYWYEHADYGVLERFVPLIHGPIDW